MVGFFSQSEKTPNQRNVHLGDLVNMTDYINHLITDNTLLCIIKFKVVIVISKPIVQRKQFSKKFWKIARKYFLATDSSLWIMNTRLHGHWTVSQQKMTTLHAAGTCMIQAAQ